MTLQQLFYIVELSKHNSISSAAQALFIAQPSLSTAIKELEKEFHITILERSRHGISFTPEGLEFLNYANHIIEQTTNLREHFSPQQEKRKKLCLSISSQHYMFATDALTAYLHSITQIPRYTITLREGRTSQVIQDVITQRSQIGIIFISKMTQKFMERTLRKNGLEFTELFSYPPYVFMNTSHPLSKYKSLSIEQLIPYPYIQYTQGEDSYQFSEEIIIPDIKPEREINITDRSTLFSIIASTDAYTVGTGILFRDWKHWPIVSIPMKNPLDIMRVGWIKSQTTTLSPTARYYIKHLINTLISLGVTLSESAQFKLEDAKAPDDSLEM
jgi:DNA-binding transcriptional LysR family regulator